jgi:hypothetical protein
VEVRDRLALDEHSALEPIVTGGQWLELNPNAQALQGGWDSAPLLEHVRGDDEVRAPGVPVDRPRSPIVGVAQLSPDVSRAAVTS